MTLDRTFIQSNRLSTERIRLLAARLSDAQMQTPVGEHWTVAIVFAHLAFWDRRVMYVLDMTERDGKLFIPEIDIFVNDLSSPCGPPSRRVKPPASPSRPPKSSTAAWKLLARPARRNLHLQ